MKSNIEESKEQKALSEQELRFCDLYVNGGLEYAGRPQKCYKEVFGENAVKNPASSAGYLLTKPHVLAHIKEMMSSERYEMETMAVKLQVSETLKAVMDETATTDYTDRFGVPLSPAPLRAVSVNAAKALMEIYPIKHTQESKLRIEGSDGNVIFNVVVPQPATVTHEEEKSD